MGMSVGSAGQSQVKSEPNVVPMIDVMLVLLIIFMIVTPLISAGFKATMPKGANLDPDPEGENEIILGIDQGGNYFIDGRAVAKEALEDQLKARYQSRDKDKILYGSVQQAIEMARTAGVRVIAAVTDRDGGLFAAEAAKKKKEGN
jgi:biopolymer transport protein TolR